MSLRRRLLRIAVTVLVIVSFTSYFAFSTLLFSPFEDEYPFDLASLVPRNVDFLVAKTDLSSAFSAFPELAISEALGESEAGSALLASPEWQRFIAENQLGDLQGTIDAQLAQLPIEVDPLNLFGGSEFLVAGYFKGADLAQAEYVAMGRTNWIGKLGQSLLSFPGLIGLEDQGIAVVEEEGVTTLNGGQLAAPIFIARILDVLVVGSNQELVAKALKLEAAKGEDSFGLSARYADYIQAQENREPDDLELFIDHDALMANLGFDGNVPDKNSQEVLPAFLARLFQLKLIKEVEGVIGFEGGLALDLHADLSSEKLSAEQKRFFRAKGFNRERIMDVAQLAPSDTGLMAYLQADVGDVLRMLLASTEPALQDNLNDQVRTIWGYSDASVLLDEVDAGLKDRLAVIVRENDYPDEGINGPPHDDTPVMAWAVIGWSKDKQVFENFRQKVSANQGRFLIQGRASGSGGVFMNTDKKTGLVVYEYWSPIVPGTGHLASVVSDEIFIISNHNKLVTEILLTRLSDPSNPSLASTNAFRSLVGLGLDSSSSIIWFDPQAIAGGLDEIAFGAARNAVQINWDIERPRIKRLVLKRDFGNRAEGDLNIDEASRFETVLEQELSSFESTFFGQNVSGLADTYRRYVTYLKAMRCVLVELSLDPKRVDISVRSVIPLGE